VVFQDFNSDPKPSKLSVTTPSVQNAEEGIKLRQDAIERMVAAIADHDFVTARHHSDEEVRLGTPSKICRARQ
jgi:hypothetical protein